MVRSSITCDQTHTNLSRMLYLSIYIPISLGFYSRGLMLVLYFPLTNKLTEPKCLIQDHLTVKSPNQNSYPVLYWSPFHRFKSKQRPEYKETVPQRKGCRTVRLVRGVESRLWIVMCAMPATLGGLTLSCQ